MSTYNVMTVQELLYNKLTETDPNHVHADNTILEQYWSSENTVAFRDCIGLLWIDSSAWSEYYCSDDDEQPSEEIPLLENKATGVWIGLRDTRGEWYRLTSSEDDNEEVFVLASSSIQYSPYERELTVIGEIPPGDWIVASPTPYKPRAILL